MLCKIKKQPVVVYLTQYKLTPMDANSPCAPLYLPCCRHTEWGAAKKTEENEDKVNKIILKRGSTSGIEKEW